MKILKHSVRVFLCIIIALVGACWIIQEDPEFKAVIQRTLLIHLSTFFNCQLTATIDSINLLTGEVVLKSIHAQPGNTQDWFWKADSITIAWSWIDVLREGKFPLSIDIDALHADSVCDRNGCAIAGQLSVLLTPVNPNIPFVLKRCAVHNITTYIHHTIGSFCITVVVDIHNHNNILKAQFVTTHGQFFIKDKPVINDIVLKGHVASVQGQLKSFVEGIVTLATSDRKELLVHLNHDPLKAEAKIYCRDKSIDFCGEWNDKHYNAHVHLDAQLLTDIDKTAQSSGVCDFSLKDCPDGTMIEGETSQIVAWGTCYQAIKAYAKGTLSQGIFTINELTGKWKTDSVITMSGQWSDYQAQVMADINNKVIQASITKNGKEEFHADLSLQKLKLWIKSATAIRLLGYPANDVSSESTLSVDGNYAFDKLNLKVSIDDFLWRIPDSYAIIHKANLAAAYCFSNNILTLHNGALYFHQGVIEVPHATIFCEGMRPVHARIPLLIKHCFISWKKDIFALLSGAPEITYQKDKGWQVKGYIIADRSQMHDNILSQEFQKSFHAPSYSSQEFYKTVALDCTFHTASPLKIKTDVLQAQAQVALACKGTLYAPDIQGTIDCRQGLFMFPYQSLYIKRGKLSFEPYRTENPHIDIVAKNKIKKYDVTMSITGSIANPDIQFSSSPSLEREQIMSLLFGGSEDGTLFIALPKTLGDSLDQLLFGSAQRAAYTYHHLNEIFKPLKNIRLVPSLSDQKGRGGLRGSLIVEVDERLRALIQQNFSLTEDTRWEVEYDISDDTSIRGIKDEHGDVGAELEMRWKF